MTDFRWFRRSRKPFSMFNAGDGRVSGEVKETDGRMVGLVARGMNVKRNVIGVNRSVVKMMCWVRMRR